MEGPSRKSNRKRQPAKKYFIDPLEGLDIIDGGDNHRDGQQLDEDDEDDDFQVDANASPEPPEDDLSVDGAFEDDEEEEEEEEEEEKEEDHEAEHDFEDGDSVIGANGVNGTPARGGRKRISLDKLKTSGMAADPRYHPRGLLEPAARGAKELQRLFMFGPAKEDQTPALKSHFKWSIEPTIPSQRPNAGGLGGFKRSYFHDEAAIKAEADEGWDWYEIEGGKEAFRDRQQSKPLTPAEAQSHLSRTAAKSSKLVMGPYKRQKLFEMGLRSTTALNDAWTPEAPTDAPPQLQEPKSYRNGWMFNFGEKVQNIEWVPNKEGTRQFFAVSTSPVLGATQEERNFNAPHAPAFTPQPSIKSSIQIWEVRANNAGSIDAGFTPRLRKVICTEWGNVRSFKWCPMPRKSPPTQPSEQLNLGLLAGVWGDGVLRVLDVSIESSEEAATEHNLLQSATFAAKPPNTICTCMTWLSSTSVAAGCANGSVGVWNLPMSVAHSQSQPTQAAEPVVFFAISSTYILNVTSCYPSRPHLLLTISMSGHVHLTDLMEMTSKSAGSPTASTKANRSRIGRTVLAWHDFSQVVLTVDDNFTLVAYPIRRFYRQVSYTRYKSFAMCLAISPIHPFVVAGCVGGEAICNNPLRRAYDPKIAIWNQTWFTHEWRPMKPNEISNNPSSDAADVTMTDAEEITEQTPELRSHGISRILEGFRCKQVKLFNSEDAFTHRENGAVYSTVYEPESSITSLSWNPNFHVGGWMAAGMASGLVRIENIAS